MYRGRFWTMRQYAGFGTAEESNERYRYLLDARADRPLRRLRPAHADGPRLRPPARARRGGQGRRRHRLARRHGDAASTGIPLGPGLHLDDHQRDRGDPARALHAVGEKQGVAPGDLQGTIQNDILKEYVARGTYIYPPRPSLRLITDIFAYSGEGDAEVEHRSRICGYHIREAGSTAVQEVAFTLADGIAYVRRRGRGAASTSTPSPARLSFFFNAHNDLLEEVAKFRAARRAVGAHHEGAVQGEGPALDDAAVPHPDRRLDAHRAAAGQQHRARRRCRRSRRCSAARQSLHTNSRDEALGLPTEDSVRIALRTQQIIANESGVADVVDPLGGSYAVEAMTDEIEGRAPSTSGRSTSWAAWSQAIAQGYVQREIQEAAYAWQREVEAKEQVVVGVNAFMATTPRSRS